MSGCKGLFTSWTMKSSQGPIKIVIGCWARPGTTSVYTKGNMSEWPWSSRSSTNIFWGLLHPLTSSNGYFGGRGKRGALVEKVGRGAMAKKCFYVKILMNFFWWEEKTREWSNLNFLKTTLFGHIFKKTMTFTFGAWSFLSVHILFTPGERPKCIVKCFFQEIRPWMLDHQVQPWKKGHLLWSDFMVHGVNRPLQIIECGYLIVISAN